MFDEKANLVYVLAIIGKKNIFEKRFFMIIRKANDSDILKISTLYIENWRKTYSGILSQNYLDNLTVENISKKWSEYLCIRGQQIFVAYEEHDFLGFVASKVDDTEVKCWYLDSLHVAEVARGKGVGTSLINTVGKYALDAGYKNMSICIVKGNDRSKTLYEKLGAMHYKDFIDNFDGIKSNSEKLMWNDLGIFAV